MVNKKLATIQQQKKWLKQELFDILNPIIKDAETLYISNLEYLKLFQIEESSTVQNIWKHLYELAKPNIHESHYEALEIILNEGTLATRILKAVGNDYSEKNIKKVYKQLADCLQENKMFDAVKLVLTCEHGGNKIPEEYQSFISKIRRCFKITSRL